MLSTAVRQQQQSGNGNGQHSHAMDPMLAQRSVLAVIASRLNIWYNIIRLCEKRACAVLCGSSVAVGKSRGVAQRSVFAVMASRESPSGGGGLTRSSRYKKHRRLASSFGRCLCVCTTYAHEAKYGSRVCESVGTVCVLIVLVLQQYVDIILDI